MDDASRLRPRCSSGSGEPSIGVRFLAGGHTWPVVLGEDLADEFPSAAHPHLIEDRLEVVAHGVPRDVQLLGDLGTHLSSLNGERVVGALGGPILLLAILAFATVGGMVAT